jgi:hypothetical protein
LSQSAALHDVALRRARSPRPTPSGPNAEAADDLPVHAPWNRRSCQLPWCHVPHTHGPQCRRTRTAPPNQPRADVHAARRRRPVAPYFGRATTHTPTWFPWCTRKSPPTTLRTAIKPVGPSSRGRRVAAVRHGCFTVNFTPPVFLRKHALLLTPLGLPVAHALACWPARAAGSPEPVPLLPPPDSRQRALLPARLPSKPTTSTHPLDPREAGRATRGPVPPLSSPEFECPGCATTGTSPPLAGNTLGQATTANQERVSPIAYPPRLFACRACPRRRRARRCRRFQGRGRQGHRCEDLKTSRGVSSKRILHLCCALEETCKIDLKS